MSRARLYVVILVVMSFPVVGAGAPGRQVVHPLADRPMPAVPVPVAVGAPATPSATQAINPWDLRQILVLGAEHIVAQQCGDGGFGWPHGDCSTTYHNITAPILMGVLTAYSYDRQAGFLTAARAGGGFEMAWTWDNGEARFGTFSAYYLWRLSQVTGDPQYANHVASGFFDELEAGSYGPDNQDTAAYIASVVAGRAGTWVNLVPWEFQTLVPVAAVLGHPGQSEAFIQGILDGLDAMNNTDPDGVPMDIDGIAGAVRGLALGGRTSFAAIVAPLHGGINGIDSLEGLGSYLVSLQNADGSWNWHSNIPSPVLSDEDTQTTAYAVMALKAADPLVAADYSGAIEAGQDWLAAQQLPNGGFPEYPGAGENTEVEGEALWALGGRAAGEPIPTLGGHGAAVLTLLLLTMGLMVMRRHFT
ncbi:MAG: terpene cyclase/mutase family protein [Acidobacteria bacterium]|nr:terpene cyclase/mutase family protein [Acidobacteriota bacterium]